MSGHGSRRTPRFSEQGNTRTRKISGQGSRQKGRTAPSRRMFFKKDILQNGCFGSLGHKALAGDRQSRYTPLHVGGAWIPQRPLQPTTPTRRHDITVTGMVRARSSAGEHYVDIVGVTGSIPVAPTILHSVEWVRCCGWSQCGNLNG